MAEPVVHGRAARASRPGRGGLVSPRAASALAARSRTTRDGIGARRPRRSVSFARASLWAAERRDDGERARRCRRRRRGRACRRRRGPRLRPRGLRGDEALRRRRAHREIGVLEVPLQGVDGVGAPRLAQRLEHRGQDARVLVLEQARRGGSRATSSPDVAERRGERGADEPVGIGIEAREDEGEARRGRRGRGRRAAGRADPGLAWRPTRGTSRAPGPGPPGSTASARRASRWTGGLGESSSGSHRGERPVRRPRTPRARRADATTASFRVPRQGRHQLDRGRVLERAEAARREGAGERVVGRGTPPGARAAASGSRDASPPRSPPTSRSGACLSPRARSCGGRRVLQAPQGEESETQLHPGIVAGSPDRPRAR